MLKTSLRPDGRLTICSLFAGWRYLCWRWQSFNRQLPSVFQPSCQCACSSSKFPPPFGGEEILPHGVKRFSCQPCTKVTTVTSRTLLPAQGAGAPAEGPNVYVTSRATVCSWATTLIGVDGTVSTCQTPLPPSLPPSLPPPSPLPRPDLDKAMNIGPIAGGVGGGLLLLAGLCGLAWKLRRMRATPKSSGLQLPQGLQGSVSPVHLLESD